MKEKQAQLEEMVQELLEKGTDEAYERLYHILCEKEYEPVLRKTSKLGLLREMVERWKEEKEEGDSHIFREIHNLEQAESTYLSIKHGLWRIEQELSVEKWTPFIERMSRRQQSKYLIAWIAYANLSRPEATLACLGAYMMQYDVVSALETLSYGLVLFPNSKEILLQKAQCLMDLNMWQEALEAMKMIEAPEAEVQQIIIELEAALSSDM